MKLLQKKSNIVVILFTKNNIICTLTTLTGYVLGWITAGSLKVRGAKKITSSVISSLIKILYTYNKKFGYMESHVKVKGFSKNKNVFLKQLKVSGLNIKSFQENLALPHNGCKRLKPRRV